MHNEHTYDFPTVDRDSLIADLQRIVPGEGVRHRPAELRPYECDGLTAYRRLPLVVVLPETIDQVRAVMRLCHARRVPVVARGAGTGLSAGALPFEQGVLLSLAKFNRILDIDAENRCARVQPGVRNLAISEAVRHLGLYYAPDPSSQIACTIGGNVAENSGGVHCLKYGLTVHNLLEVTLVTVKGEVLTVGSSALDEPGYDLLAAITGSEGMLGVVVEVKVKLTPLPHTAKVVMAAFDDVTRAGDAVGAVIGAGIIPGGLEMMDNFAIVAAEDYLHAGYPTEAAAILLCELDGTEAEVDEQIAQVQEIMRKSGAYDIRLAKDEAERVLFWAGRKNAFPAIGRISPDYYCMDGTIPRSQLGTVLVRMNELSEEYGLRIANVFHAGDGNLHPLILYNANIPGELEKTEELGAKILRLCVEVGGTITGEHGVGFEKIGEMHAQFSDAELNQFHALKRAFDPEELLNPGKAVPMPKRCAEYKTIGGAAGHDHAHCGAQED
jgi:glycolate oxidase